MDRRKTNGVGPEVPGTIGIRTDELMPLLLKWRKRNPRVAWKWLLNDALRRELAPLARKRYAHLVNGARRAA